MSTTPEAPEPLAAAPDPAMAALMDSLGGGAHDPMSMLMAQLGASNPQAAMLFQLLEQRRAETNAAVIEEAKVVDVETRPVEQVSEEDLQELRATVEKAYAELETLRARNDAVARALGACYLCFGADPLCGECGGRGAPGAMVPEPATFRQYVLPALRRAQAVDAHRRAPRARPPIHQPPAAHG